MEPNSPTHEVIPDQYSQQPTPQQPVKQNGFLLPVIGVIILLIIVGAGVYYLGITKSSGKPAIENVISTPSIQPTSTTNQNQGTTTNDLSSETNGFPIYPGAIFVESKTVPPCQEGQYSGFSICNAKIYTWQVNSNHDQVSNWYKQNNLGWTCSGGAGSYTDSNNASGVTSCKKDSLSYQLSIVTQNGVTELTLIIPQGSPTSK